MDTMAMKYFMEIASGKTYWDVAYNFNISQSSVSKAISKMEDELGVKLFDRSKRFVSLTPPGEIFFNTLTKLEPELQSALLEMSVYSSKKRISCYVVPNQDFYDMDMKIKNSRFSELYPNISLRLEGKQDPIQAIMDLNEEKVDFFIGRQFSIADRFCNFIPLIPDEFYAVLPTDHPLAGRESIDFTELYDEPIANSSLVIRQALKECCEFIGKPMLPNLELPKIPATNLRRIYLLRNVAYGHCITVYFRTDLYLFDLSDVCVVPITGCPDFPIGLFRKKGRALSDHQLKFQEYLCKNIFGQDPLYHQT